jgi:hypothetical protein
LVRFIFTLELPVLNIIFLAQFHKQLFEMLVAFPVKHGHLDVVAILGRVVSMVKRREKLSQRHITVVAARKATAHQYFKQSSFRLLTCFVLPHALASHRPCELNPSRMTLHGVSSRHFSRAFGRVDLGEAPALA